MATPVDWPFCAVDISFKPSYVRSGIEFGGQSHELASPHWVCDLIMKPATNELERRAFESLIHKNNGRGLFGVFDRRCTRPYFLRGTDGAVPDVTILAASKAGTLTVQGPVSYTHLTLPTTPYV